jgi:CubicO group peptidase (beta-lactamase class C family)
VATDGWRVVIVAGGVTPGFESVAQVLAEVDTPRGGLSFAAYVEGEKVVDLWGGEAVPGRPWEHDTLSTAMSATKGLAALCAQILWDRGELDLDAPVTHYWPEYGQAGKSATLVRHVLTHTAGLLCFEDPGALLDWSGNGWDDYDEIARRIAASPPAWEPGTRIGYHAFSIGWLLQELFRRITGDTIGRFFQNEVAQPLELDAYIGTPEAELGRVADLVTDSPAPPRGLGRIAMNMLRREQSDLTSPIAQAGVQMHGGSFSENLDFFNLAKTRTAELPAAGASTNARSLARVYAMLAEGGELDGKRIVRPDSVELFRTPVAHGRTAIWPRAGVMRLFPSPKMRYALGYEGDFGEARKPWRFGPTRETFGHLGAGGQLGLADPVRRVAVGFTRTDLRDWQVSTSLIDTLYKCVDSKGGAIR